MPQVSHSDIGANTSRSPEACRVVNCHLEAEYSDRAETKYGYELARIMTRPIVNLTIEIVGLLLGPLDDKGRAMVELRMLIDRYPTSREADGARDALRNLKAPGKGGTL